MPEEIFERIKKNIPPSWKICFASAMMMGLIAHFYKLTNWLPNWDSLVFRYDPQNMLSMGRWFLPIVCAPSSFYDLPWLAGLLALLYHALGAVCICKIFRVQKNTAAAMIGAVVITFPTVTSVLMYNYVADGYALAFLLACLAAMFLTSEKPSYVASVISITLSVGIYQAYITVTIMLLLCYLILESLREEATAASLLVKSLKLLAAGVLGMSLYYVVMTVCLKITGTELLDYQGISNAMSLSQMNIPGVFYTIKHSFTDYFFDFSGGVSVFTVLNCILFAVTVVLYLAEIIKQRTSPQKLLLILVFAIFLPIGASVLAFINSDVDYHNLMKMGFCVFYLFFILQYEKDDFSSKKLLAVKSWGILGLCAVLVFSNTVIANVSYHKLGMAYEKSYGTLIRIVDRIEQTEGAADCDRLLVLGALENSEAYSVNLPPDMTGTTDGYILRADDEVVGQSVLCSALNDYCGKNYSFVAGPEKTALLKQLDVEKIGVWPASDAIMIVDDVIVIRLGKEVQ